MVELKDVASGDQCKGTWSLGTFWEGYRGLLFGAIGTVFFSLTFIVVKELGHYHPVTVSLWKQIALLTPMIPIFAAVIYREVQSTGKVSIFASIFPFSTRETKVLLALLLVFNHTVNINIGAMQAHPKVRAVLGTTAQLLQVWSLEFLSVGDSSIFTFSSPIFVVLFATLLLGERCSVVSVGVVVITILGIVLIVRPPIFTGQTSFDVDNLKGVGFASGGMLLIAIVTIILRRLRTVHWALNIFVFATVGVLECSLAAFAIGVCHLPYGLRDTLLSFVALPFTVSIAQLCLVMALKYEKAGPVSLVGTLGVPTSFISQFIVYGIAPDIYSSVGGVMVVLGVFLITAQKYIEELPQGHSRKHKFRLLLL